MTGIQRRGRLPGDRRVRLERVKPTEFRVTPRRSRRARPPAALVLIYGFLAAVAIGTALLMLPISSRSGAVTPLVDALFTATSAVCISGLVVVDTATHWSAFGHVVILALIQAGGFGIMAGSTLLLMVVVRRGTRLRDRVMVHETMGGVDLGSARTVIRRVAIFTLVVEGAAALVLSAAFVARGGGGDLVGGVWWGTFHAVSAFMNAGFDLTGDFRSFAAFADDVVVLGTLGVAVVLGGLGYAIVGDLALKRRWRPLAMETKVVVVTSAAFLVGGAVLIGALEWENPATLGAMPEPVRALNAFFHSTSVRSAGFAVVPTGGLSEAALFVSMALMFVGGASGSTAGGIKVNTFSLLLVAIISTVRGQPSAVAFGRRIEHKLIYRALAVALLSIALVFVVAFLLLISSRAPFVGVLFEAVSALATVGLSVGHTPQTDEFERIVLSVAMFAGRLGPLTLALGLAARARPTRYRPAVEAMRIG